MPDLRHAAIDALLRIAGGLPDPLPSDPMPLAAGWLREAERAKKVANPNAMVLATVGAGGPSARVVLCKEIDEAGGSLVFFTNYESRKGEELGANPRVACVFHWDYAGRQVRLEGRAEILPSAESDAYFATRPLLSRLGAWASRQSRPLASRRELAERVLETAARFGVGLADVMSGGGHGKIPRPAHWGGFRVRLDRVELWVGGGGRLHDRAAWERAGGGVAWRGTRLNP